MARGRLGARGGSRSTGSLKDMLTLFFTSSQAWLGEVETTHGALRHVMLSPEGEKEIGSRVRLWQTRGVPVNKEMKTTTRDGQTRKLIFFKEYVQPSSKGFEIAVGKWAMDVGVMTIVLPDELVEFWHRLSALPLEPEEQFALLLALKQTPVDLLGEWQRAISDAELFARHRREDARLAVKSLQRRVSGHLLGPFVKKQT